MRQFFGIVAAIAMLAIGARGAAQTPQQKDLPPVSRLNLTMEQHHVIKEIVKEMEIDKTSTNFTAVVGETVPLNIALLPIPIPIVQKVPQIQAHRFFVTARQVVIVNANDNSVAEVIELSGN